MKFHEATNGPYGELWKAEVAEKHQRMINSGVFEPPEVEQSARRGQAFRYNMGCEKEKCWNS
jgi:hypothetical protein